MMIEVHFELGDGVPMADQLWNRLRPHAAHPGVYRLPAEHHAWHLLWHSVVVHTHRRGQLGDLLLLAETLSELDTPGRAWLEQRVRNHPATAPLLRALRMADGLKLGTAPADEFRAVAAAHYRLRTSRALSSLPARARKQLEALEPAGHDGGNAIGASVAPFVGTRSAQGNQNRPDGAPGGGIPLDDSNRQGPLTQHSRLHPT
jgi:hypothetical protein